VIPPSTALKPGEQSFENDDGKDGPIAVPSNLILFLVIVTVIGSPRAPSSKLMRKLNQINFEITFNPK